MASNYYPPVSFFFKVEFQGIGQRDGDTRFQQVSGLGAEIGIEELPVGGENRFAYRLPSRAKYRNLVLKRGMLNDSALVDWFKKAIEDFSFAPADVHVSLLNEDHQVSASWVFVQAYPVKWEVSDLDAMQNAVAVEKIELAYQYYRRTA